MKKKQLLTLAVATAIAGTTMLGATSATSDYMHYQDGTISICDPSSNGTKCITMQDKNLGASEVGTGTSSYGYHFQWGNNHGFEIGCFENQCTDTVTNGATTSTLAIWSPDYNHVGYNGGITNFMYGSSDYWENNIHYDGLRGGANDSQANNRGYDETNNVAINEEDRQGPCEEGYHVPSIGEWNQVLKYWAEENGIDLYGEDEEGLLYNYDGDQNFMQFQEDFKIPFAGDRYFSDAKVYDLGDYAYLWSSSPYAGERALGFHLSPTEVAFSYSRRSYGFSVRCFKNSPYSTSDLPSEGGDSEIIVNIAEFNGGQNTCSGSNYIFENIVAGTNTGTHTLSGVFQCAFGNGKTNSTVTLQLSGNLVADGDRVISGSNLMMKNSEWTVSPVGLKFADTLISTWKALTATQTLFQKTANLIGVASGVVEVQLTVPGGTPDGTYNGVLVLTY